MTAPGTGGPAEDAQMRRVFLDEVISALRVGKEIALEIGDEAELRRGEKAALTLRGLSAAAGSVPEDGGEALLRDDCMRADKACRWRPATTSDANPDDLVCDGCGARQRPEFAAPVRQTNGEEKR